MLAAAVLAAGGAALLVPNAGGHFPPPPERPCPGGSDSVLRRGPWTVMRKPGGLRRVTAHAAAGADGVVVLASDGRRVVRSTDSGCTWTTSYDVASQALPPALDAALPRVAAIDVPRGGDLALLAIDGAAGALPRMMRSTDAGRTWNAAGGGLPAAGRLGAVVADAAGTLLVAIAGADGRTSLYASTDDGGAWSRRSIGPALPRIAPDPLDAGVLWAVRGSALAKSPDGGVTWVALPAPSTAPWRAIAVAHKRGKPAVVAGAASAGADAETLRVAASVDGGAKFDDLPVDGLGPTADLAFGNSDNDLLMASASGSSAFDGPGLLAFDLGSRDWRDVDQLKLNGLRDPRALAVSKAVRGHTGLRALQLRRELAGSEDAVARYTPADRVRGELRVPALPACADPPARAPEELDEPVRFTPGDLDLRLTPGRTRQIQLRAEVPPLPRALDAFFLLDSSESMDAAIDGVRCSINRLARELGRRGIDAWLGAAHYRDWEENRYTRVADLSPVGPKLGPLLGAVNTTRGAQEPIRSALYQAATGEGMTFRNRLLIEPNTGASFRPGALHLAVVVGDEPYGLSTENEPTPEQVVAALRAKDIRAVGIQVTRGAFDTTTQDPNRRAGQALLRQQLTDFARASGAVAPRGGVDCDGNGTVDVRAGQPLVCGVTEQGIRSSIGDALAAILRSFRTSADVALVPRASKLSVELEGGRATGVDLGDVTALTGTVRVGCSRRQAGERLELGFDVVAAGRVVGTVLGEAICGRLDPALVPPPPIRAPSPPAPTARPVPAPAPAPQPAVAVAPPPPPPAPVPVSAPAPASAPATSGAPSGAAAPAPGQAALAAAPQAHARPQLATVDTVPRGDAAGGEHAMVATTTLGLGTTAALGWALWAAELRRRRRPQPVRVRVER